MQIWLRSSVKGSVLVRDWKFWGRNKLLECSRYFFPFAKSSPDCIKFDFKLLVVISVFLPGCVRWISTAHFGLFFTSSWCNVLSHVPTRSGIRHSLGWYLEIIKLTSEMFMCTKLKRTIELLIVVLNICSWCQQEPRLNSRGNVEHLAL